MGLISLLSTNKAVEKKSRLSWNLNPGLLGEKQEGYLCPMKRKEIWDDSAIFCSGESDKLVRFAVQNNIYITLTPAWYLKMA